MLGGDRAGAEPEVTAVGTVEELDGDATGAIAESARRTVEKECLTAATAVRAVDRQSACWGEPPVEEFNRRCETLQPRFESRS